MILGMMSDAVAHGAPETQAAALFGLSVRSLQRWREQGGDDRCLGPKSRPRNQLSEHERKVILATVDSPEFRNLSPNQLVPRLADQGHYIASESTLLRILRHEGQLTHHGRAKAPLRTDAKEHIATGPTSSGASPPSEVVSTFSISSSTSTAGASWDGRCTMKSRASMLAALFRATCDDNELDSQGLVFRSDNGSPMRGSTLLPTIDQLGARASFSRPDASADNAFSEALFRTVKYRPDYPAPFDSLDQARAWVSAFVAWYNGVALLPSP